MLITCRECGREVSDKAYACPHCGYPRNNKQPRPKPKRQRLPNGFGQISEIKGRNLKKPFRAMVTVGKTPEGRPICKTLKPEGYFETYRAAYTALIKYNENPYDVEKDITMEELYKIWSEKYYATILPQTTGQFKAAWNQCGSIYPMKVRDVRIRHLRECIEQIPKNTIKRLAKITFNKMFDYAVEYELTDKNYSRLFGLGKEIDKDMAANRKQHLSFTDDEMQTLWENITDRIVAMIVVQCYTGFRPSELLSIRLENINLEERTIVGGCKTEAGKNRIVPIHSAILDLVEQKYNEAIERKSEWLFGMYYKTKGPEQMLYMTYFNYFKRTIANLGLNPEHRPHDPRKQFATMAKKYNVDEYAIKLIMGHQITDITESIYTDRDPSWLLEEIEKIKVQVISTSVETV